MSLVDPFAELRLSPELANTRAITLEFVKRYVAHIGRSPSYREIATGTALTRRQVQAAVHGLAAEGSVFLGPGFRRISLPDPTEQLSDDDLVRVLRSRGWLLDLADAMLER